MNSALARRVAAGMTALVALSAGLLPSPSWAACTKVQPGWLWNYEGHIAGQHRIRMTLVFGQGEITGVYFYASQLKDIPLRGRLLDATRVVLEELDPAGQPSARFEAEFPQTAPESKFGSSELQCVHLYKLRALTTTQLKHHFYPLCPYLWMRILQKRFLI